MAKRTDLAMEARELWQESAGKTTLLSGVRAREDKKDGVSVTTVEILDHRGEKALGKPVGTYVTVTLEHLLQPDKLNQAAAVLGQELRSLLALRPGAYVLVVGLGNLAVTPDAVGPRSLEHLLVTRHLVEQLPDQFGSLRPVSALSPGVLGTTGLESAEIVRGVVDRVRPDSVVVVDALASRSPERVCSTVQLADTGIVPGSGVGNSRRAFNRDALGVPVAAVGVPTVVDAATLAADLMEKSGLDADYDRIAPHGAGLIVTPREIDERVQVIARVVSLGVNLALQDSLSVDEIQSLVG